MQLFPPDIVTKFGPPATSTAAGTDRETMTTGDGTAHVHQVAGVYVPTLTPLTDTVRRDDAHSYPGENFIVAPVTTGLASFQ